MARIIQVDELTDGGRRALWVNADHVVMFRAEAGGTTELTLSTGQTVRIVGEPKTHAGKMGLPLGRVLGAGV
jgi:hypothetical protein